MIIVSFIACDNFLFKIAAEDEAAEMLNLSKGELNKRRISTALSGSFGLIVLDLRQQAFVLCTRNNPNISRRNVQGSFFGADFYTDEALSAGNPCRLAKDNNDVWVKIRPIKTGAGSTFLCLI